MFAFYFNLSLLSVGITLTVLSFIFPLRASDGRVSRTLTGWLISAMWIFIFLCTDTMNDRSYSSYEHKAGVSASSSRKGASSSRKRTKRAKTSSKASGGARPVSESKYYLLALVFVAFGVMYNVSHGREKRNRATTNYILAFKGKDPHAHERPLESAIVEMLNLYPDDPEVRDWFVRATLATKSVSSPSPLKGEGERRQRRKTQEEEMDEVIEVVSETEVNNVDLELAE